MIKSIKFLQYLIREFARVLLAIILLVSGTTLLIVVHDGSDLSSVQVEAQEGWGGEALSEVYHGMSRLSPIALANACGLGASSCFKCHNGKRASAANMNSAKAPWHSQHAKVNNSCVGCHQGNPRLMKVEMAHSGMLGDPRSNLQQACSTCHSGSDLDALSKSYMSLQGENK